MRILYIAGIPNGFISVIDFVHAYCPFYKIQKIEQKTIDKFAKLNYNSSMRFRKLNFMYYRVVTLVYQFSELIAIEKFRNEVKNLYAKYAKLRDKKGLTDYRVSEETGILKSTLSEWKNGKYNPKFDKLLILAKYFDVPVEYFAETEEGR